MVTKMKELFLKYKSQLIILGIAILILIVITAVGSFGNNYVNDIIRTAVKDSETRIMKNYKDELDKRDKLIEDLNGRLVESEKKYADIETEIGKVKNARKKIKMPQNTQELRDRFTSIGYSPSK